MEATHLPGNPSVSCAPGAWRSRREDRRRVKPVFILRERRTGFDRRRDDVTFREAPLYAGPRYLRDHVWALATVLVLANVLNLVDFVMTLNALAAGFEEANPVLRGFFAVSPGVAGLFKMALVGLITGGVWRFRRYRQVLLAGMLLLTIFVAVFLFHLYGLLFVLQ